MFKVIANGTNRLDIELSGKLCAEDMRSALDELENQSTHIEQGQMCYEIIDLHMPSLGAIGVEIYRLPMLFRIMKKFACVAVLTDKIWVKKASEWEGALFPGLEIKAFSRYQKTAADIWLSNYT